MRAMISLVVGLAAYVLAGAGGAQAQDARWTLIESTGPVFVVQPLAAPRPVSLRETLAPGSTLTTGGNGRAVVRRGAQDITIGPNSRIGLPAADTGGMTRIMQDFGAAMFKVDKRGVQHFEVDTPMIAAVVKGTTFTVSVSAASHSVHVVEGLVEVSAIAGGAPVPVMAGVTAFVPVNNPATIQLVDPSKSPGDVRNPAPPVDIAPSDSSARRADAPSTTTATTTVTSLAVPQTLGGGALDYTRLSDGLVRSTPTVQAGSDAGTVLRTDEVRDADTGTKTADVSVVKDAESGLSSVTLTVTDVRTVDSISLAVSTPESLAMPNGNDTLTTSPVVKVENGNGALAGGAIPITEISVSPSNGNGDLLGSVTAVAPITSEPVSLPIDNGNGTLSSVVDAGSGTLLSETGGLLTRGGVIESLK